MVYRVKELAELSGVSTRTLRYYDQIGLLRPEREDANGYRIYGKAQVDLLQQILFYRELGMSLDEIGRILAAPGYDRERAFAQHLERLQGKKEQIEALIENVKKTMKSMKEGSDMSDKEKFEGFKKDLIRENMEKYGDEVVERYGKEALDASNAAVAGMTKGDWERGERLSEELFALLKRAMEQGDPACDEAQRAADLHRQWLSLFWGSAKYSKQAHRGMAQMYVADERFTAYYDERAGVGATRFLCDAIAVYTQE